MRRNLNKVRGTWEAGIHNTRQEVPTPVSGMFYQAVVMTILLYGSESQVLSPSGVRVLEGSHVEATHLMTGMHPQ